MKTTLSLCIALAGSLLAGTVFAAKFEPAVRLEQLNATAKAPVNGVDLRVPSTVYDWEVIDDRNIIVWHTRSKAYWVGLEESDGCRYLDREYSMRLERGAFDLDSRSGAIRLSHGNWCNIESVRPIDVKALKALEKSAKDAKKA